MEIFWRAIRHDFIKLSPHTLSDPVIPVLGVHCKGARDKGAHTRAICGDGSYMQCGHLFPGECKGKMWQMYAMMQQKVTTD